MPWFRRKAKAIHGYTETHYSTQNHQIIVEKPAEIVEQALHVPAPISKLPPEILGFIFHIYTEEKTRAIVCLLLVCKAWRHVAFHTPELWTTINIKIALESTKRRDQSHQIKLCIENSGCLPLHLDFDAGGLLGPQTSQYHLRNLKRDISNAFLELKKKSQALSERWRTWRISLPCKYGGLIGPDIAILLNMPAPNLVRVSLRNLKCLPRGSRERPTILSQHAALRQLLIDESSLSNIPDSVNNPKYLEIEFNRFLSGLTQLERFRSLNTLIIQQSPNSYTLLLLQGTLKLSHLRVLILGNGAELDETASFDLPALRTLCTQSCYPSKQANLPHLTPIRLAWTPKESYMLIYFQRGMAMRYVELLLGTYQSIKQLILPGGVLRPFFDLPSLMSLLPLSVTSVVFDNSPAAPSIYHIVRGQLEPFSQAPPLDYDWRGSFN